MIPAATVSAVTTTTGISDGDRVAGMQAALADYAALFFGFFHQ